MNLNTPNCESVSVSPPVVKTLGISRAAAYQAVREGKLPARRIGRRILVPVTALRRWLEDGHVE